PPGRTSRHDTSDAELVLRPTDVDEPCGAKRRLRPARQVGADLNEERTAGLEPLVRLTGESAHQPKPVVGAVGERLERLELADLARQFLEVAAQNVRRVNGEDIDAAAQAPGQSV